MALAWIDRGMYGYSPRIDRKDDKKGVPADLVDLLTSDRLGHVSALRADGSIATYLMWIDWDGEHVLTSSAVGSRKGAHWRRNPQASVSAVDADDPWRFAIVRGQVTDIRPDEGLAFIDRCRGATRAGRIGSGVRNARSS